MKFKEFLTESKETKNVHLEHLEDEVINGGVVGTRGAINFLRSLRDMLSGSSESKVNVTTKWDGAPAIVAGIDPETKKFFVATKHGAFSKNPKLNFTPKDIDDNHPAEGLNKKLKIALEHLSKLGIKEVYQGDMVFTKEDLKKETIDGVNYIVFQPNTITYAVPSDSQLAKTMLTSQMGIVFHTVYRGKKVSEMEGSFNIDISNFRKSKDVWYRDAYFIDASGTATFTEEETKSINSVLTEAGRLFNSMNPLVMNRFAASETYKVYLKTFNNTKVREGQEIKDTSKHVNEFIRWVEDKLNKNILEAKKQDTKRKRQIEKTEILRFMRTNSVEIKKMIDMQNLLVKAKTMIIEKLKEIKQVTNAFLRTDRGFKITSPEGFVAVSKLKGDAVKLVDRLEFSYANFNVAKNWTK